MTSPPPLPPDLDPQPVLAPPSAPAPAPPDLVPQATAASSPDSGLPDSGPCDSGSPTSGPPGSGLAVGPGLHSSGSPNSGSRDSGLPSSGLPSSAPAPASNGPFGGDLRLSRAYLLGVAEPPAPALSRFVAQVGPVVAAERVWSREVPANVRDETVARRELDVAEHHIALARAVGARLVIPEDDDWPAWPLLALDVASTRGVRWACGPLALWILGDLNLAEATGSAVALVGARAATGYGEHVAAEFGHELAASGATVVSGAAYGIDGAAHRGALAAGGPTAALLGCGIDMPYPAGHAALLRGIARSGAVISEYAPGTRPARHRFLVRNRLIAAMSAGTVVIEAGRRSGARNTAAAAEALGKVLMAVPGPITSAMSVGCHELLRTGTATAVTSAAEVLETVGTVGTGLVEQVRAETRRTDTLDDHSLRVHEALERDIGSSAERVTAVSGVPLTRVRAILPRLELGGFVERCESGWRLTAGSDHSPKGRGDA